MFGETALQVAIIHQYLASAYQNYKTALEHQEKCHKILESQFQEDHPLLMKSKLWIGALTKLSVEQELQKEKDR